MDTLEGAALIESYFEVNDAKIEVTRGAMMFMVIPTFCIEGDSVLRF